MQSFQQNRHITFHALVALKLLVSLISRLVACSARIVVDRQTDRQTDRHTDQLHTVTLATHARRGLMKAVPRRYLVAYARKIYAHNAPRPPGYPGTCVSQRGNLLRRLSIRMRKSTTNRLTTRSRYSSAISTNEKIRLQKNMKSCYQLIPF